MGRIYRKAKKRGAKVPFLSFVAPMVIILASLGQLMAIYIITVTPVFDYQEYWCGSFDFQLPLIYMFPLVFILLLVYLLADGFRVVMETRILGGKFLVIFVMLFALLSGEIYAYYFLHNTVHVNKCDEYITGFEPKFGQGYGDPAFFPFVHEYSIRMDPNSQPLCPSGPPMGRWCRNSRVPEDEFLALGREIFGPDWHPEIKKGYREVWSAINCHQYRDCY